MNCDFWNIFFFKLKFYKEKGIWKITKKWKQERILNMFVNLPGLINAKQILI